MEETVQLSTLLDYVLQKSYGDLTQLAELLPRNSDEDKKLRIVQYARQTRQLLIQLLALVKWAQTSNPVKHCTEVFRELNHQSWVYVDTADQLAHLSRNTLQQAMMPNLSLAPAIDVTTTGTYPRLPTCIRNRIIPRPPLTSTERESTFEMLEAVIRFRLSREHLPSTMMKVKNIGNGRVVLTVPYEFEVTLTLVGDDLSLPWRVLDLKILVGHALSGSPVLVNEQQRMYLHQLVQSRLCSEDGSLHDLFVTLHHFCLSLQLDCLHAEVERLSVAVCGVYMKVEEYVPGHLIRLVYWRHIGPAYLLNNSSSPWPRIVISVNPHSHSRQLVTTHSPPLEAELSLHPNKLSFQDMLVQCIRLRSMSILGQLQKVFSGTPWEDKAVLLSNPPCLAVTLSSSLVKQKLLLSVDIRIGLVVASLEGVVKHRNEFVNKTLQLVEDDVLHSHHLLINHFELLLCQLHLSNLSSLSASCGLTHTYSLPLLSPLPDISAPLFVKLDPVTFLVISATWKGGGGGGGVEESYFLLRVSPATYLPLVTDENIPRSFFKLETLIRINPAEAFDHMSGIVTMSQGSSRLKRKLLDHAHLVPSAKRLCLYPEVPLPPLSGLLATQNVLSLLRLSLNSAGVYALSKVTASLGTVCLQVYNIGGNEGTEGDGKSGRGSLLSSLLVSYELWPNRDYVLCKMVFTNIFVPGGPVITIQRRLSISGNIGQHVKQDWLDKSLLLHEVLELRSFIEGTDSGQAPFKGCSIKVYDYDTLLVQYGEYSIGFQAQGKGVIVLCPPSSPHYHLSSCLQTFLHKTKSLPLLIQGLCSTKVALSKFIAGYRTAHGYQISGINPSYLKLSKGNVSLSVQISSEGGVSFCGISCDKDSVPSIDTQTTLIRILQSFLELQLTGKLPNADSADDSYSLLPPTASKPVLGRTPFPIPSPRLSSPLPSIPSLPPPASEFPGARGGVVSLESPIWERHVTLSQLTPLLEPSNNEEGGGGGGLTPLELFVGSLALLLHWVREAAMDRYINHQMSLVSVDRGVFSYKTENLSLSLSLHPTTMLSLFLSVKPGQDNVWLPAELQLLADFFHANVVKPPFSSTALSAFMQLFWIPLKTLKACINIMKMQMQPPEGPPWRVEFCLVVPKNADLGDYARPGMPGIIFRGKVLILLHLIRRSDSAQLLIPFLHDPKSNSNFVPKRNVPNSRSELSPPLQFVDQALRKFHSSEHGGGANSSSLHNESSLARSVSHLLTLNIPV